MKGLDGLDRKEVAPDLSVIPKPVEAPENLHGAINALPSHVRIGVQLELSNGSNVADAVRRVVGNGPVQD